VNEARTECNGGDAQAPAAVVVDAAGRANPASNWLTIDFPGHSTVGGIEIAGNLVPWGETLCLTPDDLISFLGRCPTCITLEGGCVFDENCPYQQFTIRYVEINAGVPAVTVPAPEVEMRSNILLYDGIYVRHASRTLRELPHNVWIRCKGLDTTHFRRTRWSGRSRVTTAGMP
jgi:hypothetical protein